MKSLSIAILMGRWLSVYASFLLMATAGASYMFGLYSNDIKSTLGYDQTTLNLIGFFKDLGANIGLLSGLLNEITPPWVVLTVGATMNFTGYFMVWLAVTEKIPTPKVWHMCLYLTIGANSHTFINTGALVTCVKNFPQNRGIMLGLLNGYTGISAAVIAQLYHTFYGKNTKSFTLFVAWLPTATAFCFLKVIRIIKPVANHHQHKNNDRKLLYKFFYMSLVLAGVLLVLIVIENKVNFTRKEYAGSASVVLFLLFLPLVIVGLEEYRLWKDEKNRAMSSPVTTTAAVAVATPRFDGDKKVISCWKDVFSPPEIGEDHTILQAVFSPEMITLFLTTMCGIGGTLSMMDNLGQIGTSLGYSLESITTFVSLTSVWIFLGETLAGILSEILITRYKFPRPLMFTLTLLFSCIGYLLIAFNIRIGLYVASVVTGFCFGAQWPLLFSVVSEIFGLKHYSTLYNISAMASPSGLYLLNVKITGYLYDREAMKQLRALGQERKSGEELRCNGGECYKLSFIIITGVTLFGALVSLVLVFRTRKFYRSDIYKRFREVEISPAPEKAGESPEGEAVLETGKGQFT